MGRAGRPSVFRVAIILAGGANISRQHGRIQLTRNRIMVVGSRWRGEVAALGAQTRGSRAKGDRAVPRTCRIRCCRALVLQAVATATRSLKVFWHIPAACGEGAGKDGRYGAF